jgi:hypothetical protein
MPIYERAVRELIRDAAVAIGITKERPVDRREVIAWFQEHYPKIKKGTITAHLIKMSVNAPSRVHYSVRSDGSDDLLFQVDPKHFRLYDPSHDAAPIYARPIATVPGETLPDDVQEEESDDLEVGGSRSAFAYEHDLRDYLAKNLGLIESGLRLYDDEGVRGVEYPVGGRFIDILGLDREGSLVVIELKVSRGYDRVVGQLLRYMGWITVNLAEPAQRVRGIIVARQITEDLQLACARLADIDLFEYELSVLLRRASFENPTRQPLQLT